MFMKALEQAKECINKQMNHEQYVEFVGKSELIEYVDTIIIDMDAYQRLETIMSKEYLK